MACDVVIDPRMDPQAAHVVGHIGDSTSCQVTHALASLLSNRPRGDVYVYLAGGLGYALGMDHSYFVDRLSSVTERVHPDVLVIQLGTNDLHPSKDTSLVDTDEELDALIASLLEPVPALTRILWVLPGPGVPQPERMRLQASLERQARHIQVLDLAQATEIYEPDGVHFALPDYAAGAIAFAIDRR